MESNKKELDKSQKVFITGGAGFIGFHLSKSLLNKGCHVIGLDNLNDYYEVKLKMDRLKILRNHDNYKFYKDDLSDKERLNFIFSEERPDIVVNLGAQAGVRYSIDNPDAYMQSNVIGFYNILECCRKYPVEHLVFASSSSVYGANKKVPFSTEDMVDYPVSLYAATKKSNELMAHCYSKLYKIPATGLRFFTVYGPFGRPDMAYFKFAKKIMNGEPIQVYNNGDMMRDFTFIDDIVLGVENILSNPPAEMETGARYKVYNIGNNKPESLMYFIQTLEKCLGRKAEKQFLPMQPGDVYQTYADVTELMRDFDFKPSTSIEIGLAKFVEWFKEYYGL
ncbi:NAD-dependent epimerase [Diplocloster modestus]|uniref:NAD-dependent epimerase n=1 Tax=Diplocloster modestus TaxID=2850322 RepID=A0ABS6K190_9FIRM|nr:NAD-dependent epimerase [Diplocloster modestus]MBU9724614.1 NAD-dependent epimerase [Diplocloster modestus]